MSNIRLEVAILALALAPAIGYAIIFLSSVDTPPVATAQGATLPAAAVTAAARPGS